MKLSKTSVGTHQFWYQKTDTYIGQRIALNKYEPYLTRLMLTQVKPTDIVVDVGANLGYHSVHFAAKVKKVYAFEPEKINFQLLTKNIQANHLANVALFNLALGSRQAQKKLFLSSTNFGDHRLFGRGPNYFPIVVDRLDSVVTHKIDLIKLDVQGWEPEVILGAQNTIKKYHPKIFFEFSPELYRQAKVDARAMWRFLASEYGCIYFIDEYIQIYYPAWRLPHHSGSFWVTNDKNFQFYFGQIKDFWPKKWLKRVLGRPPT